MRPTGTFPTRRACWWRSARGHGTGSAISWRRLRAEAGLSGEEKLRSGVIALIDIGRSRPHLYKLMFSNPSADPTALARAAERSQTEFLAIVAELVGERDARRYAALLISAANGVAGMEVSGQLPNDKWGEVGAEDLIDTLVTLIAGSGRRS
ncbi:TetR-like C-terminal domain-containing protein [Streptomyces sp. NPDC050264]|uniref:TetR-like C-terminal domain-containing protein n=1 Tax=Streptomyces sp. NPDC050264 TaxID=3155038 RepID=UPI00343DAA89